ncbi:MAG: phosphoribosylaminoimidazole-succinocarboxamide synthase [Candidatus Binatia bacterium]|nr:MAG: phosphoribosylaminoimidazole-succinocarboxamide synthase [Candidatus Binatia bacterium]
MQPRALFSSDIPSLPLLFRGKVRDVYDLGDRLLIVATDRISAFDVVLPTPIPEKGRILTQLSNFWFARTSSILPNHLLDEPLERVVPDPEARAQLEGRAVVVRKARPLKVEAIVRGYLSGSGWKDYQRTGEVCGIRLPKGLRESERLPEPIFTPSTKAPQGQHDENISFDEAAAILGRELAEQVRRRSLEIYAAAARWAESRGLIIADTKFEFGLVDGELVLIDELLTPDSSRFWAKDTYEPGRPQPSFDKQFVRDYLDSIGWDHKPPAPELPPDIVQQTAAKYREALERLTRGAA